jgi:hypothetical protein
VDKLDLFDLIKAVWNEAAPNIRGMKPVKGEWFISNILWPKLQAYDADQVREAMRVEIVNGAPPQIRAVAERCADRDGVQGHSPAAEYHDDGPCPPPSPFDESRRGDEDYCKMRLFSATLAVGFQADKREAVRAGAEFAGISEEEFRAHLGDLSAKAPAARERERRHGLELVRDVIEGSRQKGGGQ